MKVYLKGIERYVTFVDKIPLNPGLDDNQEYFATVNPDNKDRSDLYYIRIDEYMHKFAFLEVLTECGAVDSFLACVGHHSGDSSQLTIFRLVGFSDEQAAVLGKLKISSTNALR